MPRDQVLLTDLALHHVMARRHLVALGYFSSASRANARLLKLRQSGLVRLVQPFAYSVAREHLYAAGRAVSNVLDPRVANLLKARSYTPRFVDHALATVELRCQLIRLGMDRWLAEPQIRHTYEVAGRTRTVEDFRPDGLAVFGECYLFIEVDRGHTSRSRFREKLNSYRTYLDCGLFKETYKESGFSLLCLTTGSLRKRHLTSALPKALPFDVAIATEADVRQASNVGEVLR